MKVVIVEDEPLMAEDLADALMKLPDDIEIVQVLSSVAEAVPYFSGNPRPDLIFCDIQLGDGKSFDIFRKAPVDAPVIFCTAYDMFALEAFRNNGIDYVLKPFTRKTIRKAVDKYKSLMGRRAPAALPDHSFPETEHPPRVSSLLVNWKDRIIPVKISDIAIFSIEYKMVQMITFSNQKYFISHTLDELEEICGNSFYRANRQYLVNRESVREVMQYHARKLLVKLSVEGRFDVLISKTKVPSFLSWLRK